VVGHFEVLLFRRRETIHEITRSVTKHEPSSRGFVDRAFHFQLKETGALIETDRLLRSSAGAWFSVLSMPPC